MNAKQPGRVSPAQGMRDASRSGIVWDRDSPIAVVAAERSFRSALRRMREAQADWVVVVRTLARSAEVYYYAYRSSELEQLAKQFPERAQWPVEHALDLHEWKSSDTARHGRPTKAGTGQDGVAAGRVVDFDATGRILGVGERRQMAAAAPRGVDETADAPFDLGPMRGGGGGGSRGDELPVSGGIGAAPPDEAPVSPPGAVDVTLSAETRTEINVGANEAVDFRIELSSEAVPLAVSQKASARKDVRIVVSLSAENDAIELVRYQEQTVDPPGPRQPRTGFFLVKGAHAGVSRLAITFRQGGTELGVIGLAVEVVAAAASSERAQGTATAAPRESADDDKLALIVEQRIEGGEVFYQYILHSEGLGLPYRKLRSKPLLDRGGGPAATAIAFVERIYERVTRELKSLADLKQLQREARALGAALCQELFDPVVARELWPLRNRIKLIQIVSWEPYIPWELVRLRDPDSGDIDDRFLAEYGLVRTLSDEMPPRELPMTRWGYLGAKFPMGTFPPIGAELEYFTGTAAHSLHGRGIKPVPIEPTQDAFYDALAACDFDVLHISCHAESPHESIERASLIIGDETSPGASKARLVEVDTITVEAEARLRQRRPLVFLNACETGRVGAVLTAWGGWPNVFLRAGASAFVGSAWAVRDKPAAAFSTAFYNALLDDKTLAEAANIARASARKLGDASWLAFKVFGHPRARRAHA